MIEQYLPPQFMGYKLVDGTKLPCNVSGRVCDAHTAANWSDHATAAAAAASGVTDGVAFSLTADDPWFFLDLDKCKQSDGTWTSEASAIFGAFAGAFGEISVSGTGLHVLGKCDPAMLQDRRNKWAGWLEFYTKERFVAFGRTGWEPIGGTLAIDTDWTQQLLRVVPQRTTLGELVQGVDPAYTGPEDDTTLITKMLASKGGAAAAFGGKATLSQLWAADATLCDLYPDYSGSADKFDRSAADAALMAHLAFWTGKDMPRMERLFRMSALMRPKFDRDDYRMNTVQGAVRMCNKVYDMARPVSNLPPPEVYLNISEMIPHFDGCTYVRDLHRVLTPDGDLLKPDQFKSYYGGHIFQMNPDGTQPEKNAFLAFTENRTHRFPKVARGVFDPGREPGGVLNNEVNTYFPADVVMTPGDVSPFMSFLVRLIPNEGDRSIILAWMASCVQNPHKKFQWAPVLQGTEGNGKTFVMNCVAYALGERFTHRPNPKEVGEKFNEWLERSLFILVEEIHMDGRRDILDGLKAKITNEFLPIRGMQQTERMTRNFSKWCFCTNYMDAVLKSVNDRRYCVFYTAQQSYDDIIRDGMNGSFFPDLYNWARGGGYAAMAHYLKHYVIPDELDPAGACHRAPRTTSTDQAVLKSLGMIETEVLECTEDGTLGFKGGWISSLALDAMLRDKHLRIGRNKRAGMLETLGYTNVGRTPSPLAWEDNKRPTLFFKGTFEGDVVNAYCKAQGYLPA